MEMHLSLDTDADIRADDGPVAWRVKDWRRRVPMAHSTFYEECKAGRIETVKRGSTTLVTTPPKAYIAALRDVAA
jgi:hypothetical protein